MDWRSFKMVVVSTLTAVVVTQAVRKVYKMCFKKTDDVKKHTNFVEKINSKQIHDVISLNNCIPTERVVALKTDLSYHNYKKLISYIRASKETLDICMYLITNKEIVDHIIRLGRKQILIRIIANEEISKMAPCEIKRLTEYSFIRLQNINDSAIQNKFCVIDGPSAVKRKYKLIHHAQKQHKDVIRNDVNGKIRQPKSFLPFIMTGSLNTAYQGELGSFDNVIITSQPQIVHKFEREFSKVWSEVELGLAKKRNK